MRWLAGLALALASAGALALGLGEIVVRSGPGEPFLAEIPIIASEPGEIESAQARLASPETFARVGLQPPQGLVGDLQFQVTRDAHGRAVVRVTSAAPVDVPALSFLIEVDWGRGRLVREYSALVDAPRAAEAVQPVIETPMPLPPDVIPRPAAPAAAAPVEAAPPAAAAAAAPARAPAAAPAAAALGPSAGGEGDARITVARGQSLFGIARELEAGSGGHSVQQLMIGLLQANPQAFIDGNINRLKAGAVLRAPRRAELEALGAAEARALVRDHIARWRQLQAPVPQPAETGPAAPAAATTAAAAAPSAPGARLEIAPAASGAERTATRSGGGAGGGGDMLANEQLRQAREDLAARDAEMQELRARVAELERLQQQQAQLIAMKDSELATAQQGLARQQAQAPADAWPAWIWIGLAALVAALVLAWLLGRRRKPSPFAVRPGYDTAALAAAVPDHLAGTAAAFGAPGPATAAFAGSGAAPPASGGTAGATAASPAFVADGPRRAAAPAAAGELPAVAASPPGPAWHPGGDAAAGIAPLNPAPAGRERLELAVAYLDLGDVETARDLLHEVVAGGDELARAEAARLLRDLG